MDTDPPPTYGAVTGQSVQYPSAPYPPALGRDSFAVNPDGQPPAYYPPGVQGYNQGAVYPPTGTPATHGPGLPSRPPQHEVDAHFINDPHAGHADGHHAVNMPNTYHQVNVPQPPADSPDTQDGSTGDDDGPTTLFTDKSLRLGFVKKVFAILLCQLVFTAGVMCLLLFVDPIKDYLVLNDWVYITSLIISIILTFIFGFVTKLRRRWPWNMVFLLIITLTWSVTLGAVASTMEADEVLMAVGVVAAVVAVCSLLGFQRKFDFTPMVGFVSMLGMCLVGFAFLSIFFYSRITSIVFACLGAFIFSMWLLLDIQLILGGKHKLGLSPEEYVSGALNLYVDIVYILLMIFFVFKAT